MLRIYFEILLPLILPTLLYLLWMWLAALLQRGEVAGWSELPWLWLAATGVVLLAAMLFLLPLRFGTPATGVYVPPRWENGRIIPGHIEPSRGP